MHILRTTISQINDFIKDANNHEYICRTIADILENSDDDIFYARYLQQSSKHEPCDGTMTSGWSFEADHRCDRASCALLDPVLTHMMGLFDTSACPETFTVGDRADRRIVIVIGRMCTRPFAERLCILRLSRHCGEACISFTDERLQRPARRHDILQAVARHAASRSRILARRQARGMPDPRPEAALTTREIECLKWSADGKTAWEISRILTISRRTVEHHLASASRKLQAVSRAHCVAEAIRRRIIC